VINHLAAPHLGLKIDEPLRFIRENPLAFSWTYLYERIDLLNESIMYHYNQKVDLNGSILDYVNSGHIDWGNRDIAKEDIMKDLGYTDFQKVSIN
jgi:hypothetical protein